ncbi:hypothetical protein [Primorskyibacter sp. S87]|uniref:hypothetical protein n=1 Tax=Primorskyibacter sp. S87 TaxID=3415126 RepID=UPI003C7BD9F7
MKPGFALSLSFEGITLLRRAAGGWRNVGHVALDCDDLAAELTELRNRALALEPDGFYCKLILPNDQVRYLTVDTGSVSGAEAQEVIRETLAEATPYGLDELAWDQVEDGNSTHLAAVARETLAEAEAFALEHQFNPVSFVAVPGENAFLGEPHFGPTRYAESLGGSGFEPDGIAVVDIGPLASALPEPVDETEPSAPEEPAATAAQDDSEPEPGPEPEPVETVSEPPQTGPTNAEQHDPAPGFASRRQKETSTPSLAGVTRNGPLPKSPAHKSSPTDVSDQAADPAQTARVTEPVLDVPEDPKPSPAKTGKAPDATSELTDKTGPRASSIPPAPPSDAEALGEGDDETARMTVFGARDKARPPRNKPRHLALILTVVLLLFLAGVAAWASLFVDGGVAGLFSTRSEIRQAETNAPEIPPTPSEPTTAVTAETGPATEETAPTSDPEAPLSSPRGEQALQDALQMLPERVPVASAPPEPPVGEIDIANALPLPESVPSAEDMDGAPDDVEMAEMSHLAETPTDPEAAEGEDPVVTARYAATGISQTAPNAPDEPGLVGLGDLYVASIDNNTLSQDAVALPGAGGLETDIGPVISTLPTTPGSRFDLNAQGLVEPSADGTANPDGVLVYLGKPPRIPPATPERANPEAESADIQDRLASVRPRLRPGNLIEQSERARLGGRSREELASVRPKARPNSLKDRAEQDQTPTKFAVAQSKRPKVRPRTVVAAVARAQSAPKNTASAANSQPSEDRQTGTIAPRTVKPKAPSSASVARQATIKNSINLQKVNLIGVYGTPSNRRALVRLPSGRYKKVKVGDRIEGGRVVAIGDSELRYQKSGRNLTLKIPN